MNLFPCIQNIEFVGESLVWSLMKKHLNNTFYIFSKDTIHKIPYHKMWKKVLQNIGNAEFKNSNFLLNSKISISAPSGKINILIKKTE